MNSSFEFLDYLIFVIYALVILGLGLWVSRNKEGEEKSAEVLADKLKNELSWNTTIPNYPTLVLPDIRGY